MPKSRVLSPYNNKNDVIRPAHATNNNVSTAISAGGNTPNTLILFSPTFRGKRYVQNIPSAVDQPHSRHNRQIYFTGYKERIGVLATSHFFWRRIVFWSYQRVPIAGGPIKGGSEGQPQAYYTRQLTPIANTEELRNWVFRGTSGVDYTPATLHQAPLDHDNIDVVMDKTYQMNSNSGEPKMVYRKHFFRGGRIIYADDEVGNYDIGSPYSSLSRRSKGNLFILDVFSDGSFHSSNQQVGQFQTEGHLFWSE